MTSNEELSDLRARFLALEGNLLIEIHGWLIGVACAVERQRGADPRDADRLMAELRASKGPPELRGVELTEIEKTMRSLAKALAEEKSRESGTEGGPKE